LINVLWSRVRTGMYICTMSNNVRAHCIFNDTVYCIEHLRVGWRNPRLILAICGHGQNRGALIFAGIGKKGTITPVEYEYDLEKIFFSINFDIGFV
jgi:hypothetical protein